MSEYQNKNCKHNTWLLFLSKSNFKNQLRQIFTKSVSNFWKIYLTNFNCVISEMNSTYFIQMFSKTGKFILLYCIAKCTLHDNINNFSSTNISRTELWGTICIAVFNIFQVQSFQTQNKGIKMTWAWKNNRHVIIWYIHFPPTKNKKINYHFFNCQFKNKKRISIDIFFQIFF